LTIETDSEEGFDALFDHAWNTWEESYLERLSWIKEEWNRATGEHSEGPECVAVAFDGDDAGQKAVEVILLKLLNLPETEASYIRNLSFGKQSVDQCVQSLNNWELADELAGWDHAKKINNAPEWWYDMCDQYRSACLRAITKRAKYINELNGLDYIHTYIETHTITDILAEYGINAVAGKVIHCPMHDDSTPSLKIFADNKRAYCFNQACALWNEGYGTNSFTLNKILSR
jgi:hypothetical protein